MKKHTITPKRSITEDIEHLLNQQIYQEAKASADYLAMASWSEVNGYAGAAHFLYKQSDEERSHMMRIFRYTQEAGGYALVPSIDKIPTQYESLRQVFDSLLEQELAVSRSINSIVEASLACGDYTTHHFLGWFLNEQREEENTARQLASLFDKFDESSMSMALIDKQIGRLSEKE